MTKNILDRSGSKSGQSLRSMYPVMPFYGGCISARLVNNELCEGTIYHVFYNMPDDRGTVAITGKLVVSFLSNYCYDISSQFPDTPPVFRIAVDIKKIREVLKIYVKKFDVDYESDNERFNYGIGVRDGLEDSVELLDKLIDNGWTDIIVVTAGQKYERNRGLIDFIDLNNDFFKNCLPYNEFPFLIDGSIVLAHGFLLDNFPPGRILHSRQGTYIFPNYLEYKIESEAYKQLQITFDQSTFDIYNSSTSEVGKIRGGIAPVTTADKIMEPLTKLRWPSVNQIVDQIMNGLNSAGADEKGERIRRRGLRGAEGLIRRAQRARNNGNSAAADKYEEGANEILQGILENCQDNQDDYNENVKNADPMSDDLEKAANASLNNQAVIDALGGDDISSQETFDHIREKYRERKDKQAKEVRKSKVTSPDYRKKVKKLLDSAVNEELTTMGPAVPPNHNDLAAAIAEGSYDYIESQIHRLVEGRDDSKTIRAREKYSIENIKKMKLVMGLGDSVFQTNIEKKLRELELLVDKQIIFVNQSRELHPRVRTALLNIKNTF